MTGNFSGGTQVFEDKPVLNEPFDQAFFDRQRSKRSAPKVQEAERLEEVPTAASAIVGGTGTQVSGAERLKEGIRLFDLGQWENALWELRSVEPSEIGDRDKVNLAYYLGLCLTKLGKLGEAMLHLEKAVSLIPDIPRIYQCRMALAYIYVTTGSPRMAEIELERLVESGFASPELFNTMAYTAYERKHFRHAIEFYEKALILDAENATALNGIGYVLVDTGIDLPRGLGCCRRAVEKKPDNPAYLDSLGWACYKLSYNGEAGDWLRKANKIAPNEATIREHLRVVTGGAR
ncbi:MAG: hypothetical protein FWD94_02360 [Treponema sp.]|nr:hypothetical protein [Treponema sp.]